MTFIMKTSYLAVILAVIPIFMILIYPSATKPDNGWAPDFSADFFFYFETCIAVVAIIFGIFGLTEYKKNKNIMDAALCITSIVIGASAIFILFRISN